MGALTCYLLAIVVAALDINITSLGIIQATDFLAAKDVVRDDVRCYHPQRAPSPLTIHCSSATRSASLASMRLL